MKIPFEKLHARPVFFYDIMQTFYSDRRCKLQNDFSKSLFVFRSEKSFWLISLTREKKLQNVTKANLSRVQFCNVFSNSYFCGALYRSKPLNVAKRATKRCFSDYQL